MAIRTLSGFQVGSKEPIDSRIVVTKEQMLGMNDNLMPDIYPAWCPQDGKMYVYRKENSKDVETGRFRAVESNGAELDVVGNAAVTDSAPALTSLKIGDTVYKINGGGGVCEYPDYLSTSHYIYKAKQSELTDCNLLQDSIAILFQQSDGVPAGSASVKKDDCYFAVHFCWEEYATAAKGNIALLINRQSVWNCDFGAVGADGKFSSQGIATGLYRIRPGDSVTIAISDYEFTYKDEYTEDPTLGISFHTIPVKYDTSGQGSGCSCVANPETDENTPMLNSITIGGQAYKIGGSGGAVKEVIDWDSYYIYHTKYNDPYYSPGQADIAINLCEKGKLRKAYSQTIDTTCYFTTVLRTDYSHIKSINGIYAVYVNNKPVAICDVPSHEEGFIPSSGMVRVEPDDEVYAMLYDATVEWEEGYEPPRELEMFDVCWYVFPVKYEAIEGQGGGSGSGTTVVANPDDATQSDPAITSIKIDGQNYKIEGGSGTEPDLTNYIQKSDTAGLVKNDGTIDTSAYITAAEIPEIPVIPQNVSYFTNDAGYATSQDLENKVDKVEGKGLSAEDFTTELKFKLENMSEHGEENMIDAIEFNGESVPVSNKVAQITYTPPVRPEFAYTIMNYDENDQYTIARTKHNCGSHPFVWCWSGNNLVQVSVVDNVDGDITVKWNSASLVTPENPLYVFFMNLNCEVGVEPKTKYRLDEIPYLAFVDNSTAESNIGAIGKNSTTNTTCPPDLVIPTKVIDNGVEYTVTKINSFASMTRLKSVEIPDTVTSYTNRNFQGCSNLEEVRLSTSNTGIQFAMFQECSKLRTINLEHITNIQDQAFLQCENLEMDDIPPLCTKIGNSAFSSCYKIGPILHIPRTMTSISAGAFGYNPQLTAVYIPDNGLSLSQNVFRSCENVQIYCEATEKPSNWNANCFQYIDEATQVHYGCTLDY